MPVELVRKVDSDSDGDLSVDEGLGDPPEESRLRQQATQKHLPRGVYVVLCQNSEDPALDLTVIRTFIIAWMETGVMLIKSLSLMHVITHQESFLSHHPLP